MPSDTSGNGTKRCRRSKFAVWQLLPFDLPEHSGTILLILVALIAFAVWFASRGGNQVHLTVVDVKQAQTFGGISVGIDRVFFSKYRGYTKVYVTGTICNSMTESLRMYDEVQNPEQRNQLYWGNGEKRRVSRVEVNDTADQD